MDGSFSILFILLGLPFSGKTTLANLIAEKFDAKVVSSDEIVERYHSKENKWLLAIEDMKSEARKKLSEGNSVVVDNGNYLREQRNELKRIAREAGAEHITIFFNFKIPTLEKRMKTNADSGKRPPVSRETFEKHQKLLQKPRGKSNLIVVDENTEKAELLQKIKNMLK